MNQAIESFDSETGFRSAVDRTLALARREIRIFDRNLARMKIHDSSHVATLSAFLSGNRNRRLRIVLHDVSLLERDMPRLLTLLKDHVHAVAVRRTPDPLRHLADSWVLVDGMHGTIRFHEDQPRGKRIFASEPEIRPWWQRFDSLWEASEPCSPGAVTGL